MSGVAAHPPLGHVPFKEMHIQAAARNKTPGGARRARRRAGAGDGTGSAASRRRDELVEHQVRSPGKASTRSPRTCSAFQPFAGPSQTVVIRFKQAHVFAKGAPTTMARARNWNISSGVGATTHEYALERGLTQGRTPAVSLERARKRGRAQQNDRPSLHRGDIPWPVGRQDVEKDVRAYVRGENHAARTAFPDPQERMATNARDAIRSEPGPPASRFRATGSRLRTRSDCYVPSARLRALHALTRPTSPDCREPPRARRFVEGGGPSLRPRAANQSTPCPSRRRRPGKSRRTRSAARPTFRAGARPKPSRGSMAAHCSGTLQTRGQRHVVANPAHAALRAFAPFVLPRLGWERRFLTCDRTAVASMPQDGETCAAIVAGLGPTRTCTAGGRENPPSISRASRASHLPPTLHLASRHREGPRPLPFRRPKLDAAHETRGRRSLHHEEAARDGDPQVSRRGGGRPARPRRRFSARPRPVLLRAI